jgi:U3 small nucleolar RNA-associated protein 15
VQALTQRVIVAVDASQSAWSVQGMVDMLTASVGVEEAAEA